MHLFDDTKNYSMKIVALKMNCVRAVYNFRPESCWNRAQWHTTEWDESSVSVSLPYQAASAFCSWEALTIKSTQRSVCWGKRRQAALARHHQRTLFSFFVSVGGFFNCASPARPGLWHKLYSSPLYTRREFTHCAATRVPPIWSALTRDAIASLFAQLIMARVSCIIYIYAPEDFLGLQPWNYWD